MKLNGGEYVSVYRISVIIQNDHEFGIKNVSLGKKKNFKISLLSQRLNIYFTFFVTLQRITGDMLFYAL